MAIIYKWSLATLFSLRGERCKMNAFWDGNWSWYRDSWFDYISEPAFTCFVSASDLTELWLRSSSFPTYQRLPSCVSMIFKFLDILSIAFGFFLTCSHVLLQRKILFFLSYAAAFTSALWEELLPSMCFGFLIYVLIPSLHSTNVTTSTEFVIFSSYLAAIFSRILIYHSEAHFLGHLLSDVNTALQFILQSEDWFVATTYRIAG